MVIILFFLLVAVWAAVLLPSVMNARRETVVNETRAPEAPADRPSAQRSDDARRRVLARRRLALIVLGSAALITLAAAIFTGSFVLLIATLTVDVLLAVYVAVLLEVKQRGRTGSPQQTSGRGTGESSPVKVVGG
jgi:hypothetical protein